jgi:hypothetical protein
VCRVRFCIAAAILIFIIPVATPLRASRFYILEDYYNLFDVSYARGPLPFVVDRGPLTTLYDNSFIADSSFLDRLENDEVLQDSLVKLNLEGEVQFNLRYGKDFSLKRGTITGAGSAGISDGFAYDLIERILLTGSIGDRIYIEFDFDSEREEVELGGDRNTYHVMYKGKDDEFVKEASFGNKEMAIRDSRYIDIDEGNQDSFALRGKAGWKNLHMEGLFRFNRAFQGRKEFRGLKNSIQIDALDVDYVKRTFFFLPDADIDENSLEAYRTATSQVDLTANGKEFVLLNRGTDYSFDNTNGRLFLLDSLALDEELLVFYEKGGVPVGDTTLGQNAIINGSPSTPTRENFNSTSFSQYFISAGTRTYLFLYQEAFNSYWELKNAYFLDEFEGNALFNIEIDLVSSINRGINDNYDDLLSQYEVDIERGAILFNFEDTVGFYPRPFPGIFPFTHPTTPDNPFDPDNPVYGSVGEPLVEDSINTLLITYSYNAETYFLDFNIVPGSVEVTVNGNMLEPKFYSVEYDIGFLTFSPGIVKPSDTIVIDYRYTAFGAGDQSLFSAFGLYYENGFFYAQNLTAYDTVIKGRQAPEIGSEGSSVLANSTEAQLKFGATDGDESGFYAQLDSGFAFSFSNQNVYGSAILADMEKQEFSTDIVINDGEWILGSESTILAAAPISLTLGTRGDVLYKNYWKEGFLSGPKLQTLSWNIPSNQVFDYEDKSGPYNTADKPSGGADTSLVAEYDFISGSADAYVSIVVPLNNANFSAFERFNMVMRGGDISGSNVRIYAELLQDYDEDINANGEIDEESSINDRGFSITPTDGNSTVIGTDRDGDSNGQIESEDLNDNDVLDTGTELGVVLEEVSTPYLEELGPGDSAWRYISVNVLNLINSNPEVFQNASALRITVVATDGILTTDSSGKIVVNRIWFSGSSIVNNAEQNLNVSEVSVDDDPVVDDNAFSKSFSSLYEELHGSDNFRERNDLVEKVLKVFFIPTLTSGNEATISKRFGFPADLSYYRDYKMYLFLPSSETVPANLAFTLSFISIESSEQLQVTLPGGQMQQGWNTISVSLRTPYRVKINGQEIGSMSRTGTLRVLKRVSEIQFGFKAEGGDVTQPLEIWLDEWHVSDSEGNFDKAYFGEATAGYRGGLLYISDFSVVEDPSLTLGLERGEGNFFEDGEDNFVEDRDLKSDKYFADVRSKLFSYLGTDVYVSREDIEKKRNEDVLPGGLDTDGSISQQFHSLELDLDNQHVPVLTHSFDRIVNNTKEIELGSTDFTHTDRTEYDESLFFSEEVDFPFGISQSYTFSRNWISSSTEQVIPAVSLIPVEKMNATLNQQDRIDGSFGWRSNSIGGYYTRDRLYSGSGVPRSGGWGSSYLYKLKSLFGPASAALEDGLLSSKTDGYGLYTFFPLQNSVGFDFVFDTSFSELNFGVDNAFRDTIYDHVFTLSVPFYFLGNENIVVTPFMERTFRGEYKKVDSSLDRGDIYLRSYGYLFLPPFWFINPFKGLGRIKDYDAVDIYNTTGNITGNTINTLYNRYALDLEFGYEQWYIPSFINLSIDGETKREGASYTQKRGFGATVTDTVLLGNADQFYFKNISVSFSYDMNRDYATKLLDNIFGIDTEYNRLRTEFGGIRIAHYINYTRQRQKLNDKRYYLIPGDPVTGSTVSPKPPSDTIENELRFEYLWEFFPQGRTFYFLRPDPEFRSSFQSEEKVTIENIYKITRRSQAAPFSNIPLRVTLEHLTDYNVTDSVVFSMFGKTVFGIEEKVFPDAVEGNTLPSMGFEMGITLEIIF